MSEILGALFKYVAMVLGVGAVMMVLYNAFGQNKVGSAISDLTQLEGNIQSLYTGSTPFTTLTTAVAVSGKLAPASMISGTNLSNPWGGSPTVAVNAGNSAQYDVTEPNVPPDACAKFIGAFSSAVVGLKVNGTAQTLPLDPGNAVTACNLTANTMIFTFGH
jgi:hypothetical protein